MYKVVINICYVILYIWWYLIYIYILISWYDNSSGSVLVAVLIFSVECALRTLDRSLPFPPLLYWFQLVTTEANSSSPCSCGSRGNMMPLYGNGSNARVHPRGACGQYMQSCVACDTVEERHKRENTLEWSGACSNPSKTPSIVFYRIRTSAQSKEHTKHWYATGRLTSWGGRVACSW